MKISNLLAERVKGRNNHFNLLRILAATGVLVSHSWPISIGAGAQEPFQAYIGYKLGTLCVFAFFSISGFFIARSYDQRRNWIGFLEARLIRLFPALLVMLTLTIILGVLLSPLNASQYWREAIGYFIGNALLLFTQFEFAGIFEKNMLPNVVNGSLWSLWYEFFCYLTVVLIGLCGAFSNESRARTFSILMVILCLFLHYWHQIAPLNGLPYGDATYAHVGLPFALGAAFYVWRRILIISPFILITLIGLTWFFRGSLLYLPMLQLTLTYACLLLGYAKAPLFLYYNRIGDYSYGLYIYAFPIQQFLASINEVSDPWLNMMWALPVSLFFAVCSWHFVEAPSQKFRGRLLVSRRFVR